ncbi:MAG: M28 family peptidase [Thermoanaerobaculia bacterium]
MNRLVTILAALLVLVFPTVGRPEAQETDPFAGFSPGAASRQLEIERLLRTSISPDRIREHLKWLSSRPHLPGSEGTRLTVQYLQETLESYGIPTETVRYDAFLPAPVSVSLELLEPVAESIQTTEDRIAADPYTQTVDLHPGWSGYSPSGEAVGQVVFGNFGSEEDLQRLVDLGVDLQGKILLLRNFSTGEGRKVRNAERFGAAGVVLYTDPAEDGFPYGDVYPEGNWRPPSSIMRRSIGFFPFSGDPLSPGWASTPGARRLRPEEVGLPRIPVLPVSYRSAERILSLLAGPVAPDDWQGALPLTYKIGPGPAKLRIRTEMDNRDRPMLNVLGRLEGSSEPERWIVVGNHHDAWIYGAGDPSSGTAALLELVRVLASMAEDGLRPERTLIFAFWDAEEMLLGGSTEWVEDHEDELLEKLVACINMDSAVFNTDRPLSVAAHPLLHELFREVSRDVSDPRTGESAFNVWRDLQNQYRKVPGVDGWGEFFDPNKELQEPWIFESPSDDAAPFFYYLGLPASDMYYGADYGMYHSIYENFHWMETVVDTTFEYHGLMAQIQGLASLRLANATLLPLDFVNEAHYWKLAYEDLRLVAEARDQTVPHLKGALDLLDSWEKEATALRQEIQLLLEDDLASLPAADLRALNEQLNQLTRNFHRLEPPLENPSQRNLFSGSSYEFENVSGGTLPGLRFALDRGDLDRAEQEAELYVEALQCRVDGLRTIRSAVKALLSGERSVSEGLGP